MFYPDGSSYEGEFSRYNRNGVGTVTYPDGTKKVLHYIDDEPVTITKTEKKE